MVQQHLACVLAALSTLLLSAAVVDASPVYGASNQLAFLDRDQQQQQRQGQQQQHTLFQSKDGDDEDEDQSAGGASRVHPHKHHHEPFEVLHHLSGISPYFDAHGPAPGPPDGCTVTNAAIFVRHSAITMNDDEWEETMGPFVKKLKHYKKDRIRDGSVLAFLKTWKTPVTEDNLEQLTGPGAQDAQNLGASLGTVYASLLPGDHDPEFKVYTASSPRDIGTSEAFIKGMFPGKEIGDKDGQIRLNKVPNKAEKWAASLTPHKACDRFNKTIGKPERDDFQKKYASKIVKRLKHEMPGFDLTWKDIVSMQQLCGYETVIRGQSPFCHAFVKHDWLNFEYSQDLYYYYQLGQHNKWTAALGIPWLQIAVSKLNETISKPVHNKDARMTQPATYNLVPTSTTAITTAKIPKATMGPNATLSQPMHIWFSHREEVPLVTHALDLFHGHDEASAEMPKGHINPDRVWRTSEILPFLGHVILERMECQVGMSARNSEKHGQDVQTRPFVRILVNSAPKQQPKCHSGPGGSCPLPDFIDYVENLPSVYGDLEKICDVEK